ncbi:MAG: threonine/serine exporter family protein [Oscillospiraceae bacterium]|nr:threonine/serine exporter family protein [Oscillospiraceae bacterium]
MAYSKEKLLDCACKLGRGLLENGGEIYRVEQAIDFFMRAYEIEDAQIFAIPATIIVTIQNDEGKAITQLERVTGSSQNMDRLHKVNDLCRWVCETTPAPEVIYKKLDEIHNAKKYSFVQVMLAYGVASAFFCYFWGGNTGDAIVAFIAGLATEYCLKYMAKVKSNIFFSNLISSMVIAVVAIIGMVTGVGHNLDMIIIGAIMTLVPGVGITNIMRDIISGDVITGTNKIAEVMLIALAIAVGIALPLAAFTTMTGGVL